MTPRNRKTLGKAGSAAPIGHVRAMLHAMRSRITRHRRSPKPTRRRSQATGGSSRNVPKLLATALVWSVITATLVYICDRLPVVRDRESLVTWVALSVLPWITIAWHNRQSRIIADKRQDLPDRRSHANQSVRRETAVAEHRTDSVNVQMQDAQHPHFARSTTPADVDSTSNFDETTVGHDHRAPAVSSSPGRNGFHDTHPLIRPPDANQRSDRQLTASDAFPARARGEFIFTAASRTHEGMRPTNQDFALATPIVLGVADGVGGRPDGAAASQTALEAVVRSLVNDPDASLAELVTASNDDVRTMVGQRSGTSAATTLDLVYLDEFGDLTGAHVGDSRVGVLARESTHIEWLTTDHATGNTLTRSIGPERTIKPDIWVHAVESGDLVIVATDGLWDRPGGTTTAEQELMGNRNQTPEVIAEALVSGAVRGGTRDNVTVVVGRISVK